MGRILGPLIVLFFLLFYQGGVFAGAPDWFPLLVALIFLFVIVSFIAPAFDGALNSTDEKLLREVQKARLADEKEKKAADAREKALTPKQKAARARQKQWENIQKQLDLEEEWRQLRRGRDNRKG